MDRIIEHILEQLEVRSRAIAEHRERLNNFGTAPLHSKIDMLLFEWSISLGGLSAGRELQSIITDLDRFMLGKTPTPCHDPDMYV